MSSLPIPSIEALKAQGNTAFLKREYSVADRFYTDALKELDAWSATSDGPVSTSVRRLKAVLLSNRAQCRLNGSQEPILHEEIVHDCSEALALDSSYLKAYLRKAAAEEALGHLDQAVVTLSRAHTVDPDNQQAKDSLRRLRETIKKRNDHFQNPESILKNLQAAMETSPPTKDSDEEIKKWLSAAHKEFTKYTSSRSGFLEAGLPEALLEILLRDPREEEKPPTVQIMAAALLEAVLHLSRTSTGQSISKLPQDVFGKQLPKLLELLPKLPPLTLDHSRNDSYRASLLHLLAQFPHSQDLKNLFDPIFQFIMQTMRDIVVSEHDQTAPPAAAGPLVSPPLSPPEQAWLNALLEALGNLARINVHNREACRNQCLPILLFGDRLVQDPVLRPMLLQALSIVTGNRKTPLLGLYDEGNETETKEEGDFAARLAKFVNLPLLGAGAIPDAPPQLLMQCTAAAQALSLLLQANPSLGISVITHGGPKYRPGQRIGDVLQRSFPTPAEVAQDSLDQEEDEAKQPPKDSAGKSRREQEQEAQVPLPLKQLILMSLSDNPRLREPATEVLALASSDSLIRATLIATGSSPQAARDPELEAEGPGMGLAARVFSEQVGSENRDVAAQSLLALSKLAAAGRLDSDRESRFDFIFRLTTLVEEIRSDGLPADFDELSLDGDSELYQYHFDSRNRGKAQKPVRRKWTALRRIQADRNAAVLQYLLEALVYFTLHVDFKKLVATHQRGEWLKLVLSFSESPDQAIRFGVLQIIRNLTTSAEDLNQEFNEEVAALKKIAQRGLPNAEVDQKQEAQRAGSEAQIKITTRLLVRSGAVVSMRQTVRKYTTARQRIQEIRARQDKGSTATSGPKDAASEKKSAGAKEIEAAEKEFEGDITAPVALALSQALLKMASDPENRGSMVQQSALQLLQHIYRLKHPGLRQAHKGLDAQFEWRLDAALAIARICISINPALFAEGMVFSLVLPLLELIREGKHELHVFEALMALTNLASFNDQVRDRIMKQQGWGEVSMALASDNQQVQRAAVECLTNLSMSDAAFEKLRDPDGEHDLRLFLMFARSDDLRSQYAALGALAMLTEDPVIALRVARLGMNRRLREPIEPKIQEIKADEDLEDEEEEEEGRADVTPRTAAQAADVGLEVIQAIARDQGRDPNIEARVSVLLKNMIEASRLEKTAAAEIGQSGDADGVD